MEAFIVRGEEMREGEYARAFWVQRPGHGEIVREKLPAGQVGEVLVRSLYSGVSRGTEALVFRGEVPESQKEVMRAPFQEGTFPGPVKYGYASVGRVEAVRDGDGVDDDVRGLEGREVFCLHPHQDRYWIPSQAVVPLPPNLPPGRAVLAANMETAVNVLWDAVPVVGDRVVVVGGGVVGLLVSWLGARVPGVELQIVDPNPARTPVARELGLDLRLEPPGRGDADLVIHASGMPQGLATALSEAGLEGTVVEASWFGVRTVPLPLGEAFHSRRLTLKSSQVGRLPPGRTPRWNHRRRMELALRLLEDERLDALVTGESAFLELPDLLPRLSREPGDTLCHRIRYD